MAQTKHEQVKGYFTLEKNIVGLSLEQIEAALGLPAGLLTKHGARILRLKRQPGVGEFAYAGSTYFPGGDGLVGLEQRLNFPIPGAWLGERLAKVVPCGPRSPEDRYPRVKDGRVEQWVLLTPVDAEEIVLLGAGQRYWPRG
jgi:hypothetical protein